MYAKEKPILLMTMPFLTPLCPPMGIACLKAYLEKWGYKVFTANAMEDMVIRQHCYLYFDHLDEFIPDNKKVNFFNIALEVLNHHFMAYTNYTEENKYKELITLIVYNHFYTEISCEQRDALLETTAVFYNRLKVFLQEIVNRIQPGLVGISSFRGTLGATKFAFEVIKKEFPAIITVMGGPVFSQELHHNSPNFKRFLEKTSYIDKFLIGEGEQIFRKFLEDELPEQRVYTLESIENDLIDINALDVPDYSDYNLTDYLYLPLYSSRGCPYSCSFCAETINWIKYRKKSVTKLADQFEYISEKYNRQLFILTDSLINPVVNALSEELLSRKIRVYWDVFFKVDKSAGSIENTSKWRSAGFYRGRMGVESGSQKILDLMDKRITVEEIKAAISGLAAAGIKTTVYILIGHPGETEDDFRMSLDLINELQDDIYEAECNPFRYYYDGQVHAEEWKKQRTLLYPVWAEDILLSQTFIVDCDPSREVIYSRMQRFVEHCRQLGIPNIYSVSDIYNADERWKTLHKNAVPPVFRIKNGIDKDFIDMACDVRLISAAKQEKNDVDFCF